MKKTLVVIPTYNEIENIEKIILKLMSVDEGIHALIVDDNSPDGTGSRADDLMSSCRGRVHVIHRPHKMGMGRAYVDGFKWALKRGYELICEMDADFSHDPDDVKRLLGNMNICDLCIGSRYVRDAGVVNWPIWREILSRSANFYVKAITGMPVFDGTAGFKCYKKEVLDNIDLDNIRSEGYAFQIEMHYKTWKKGFKIIEIPIIFTERRQGRSKMSRQIIFEAFFIVWKLVFGLVRDRNSTLRCGE